MLLPWIICHFCPASAPQFWTFPMDGAGVMVCGAQEGTLLPVFVGAGRPTVINAYHLCPWYVIRCPLEIHFCIYEGVNQILLKTTFNVSLQLAERSSMLDSDWLKDFWRSASPVLLVLVVPSLFPANQSHQVRQEREHPIFFLLERAQWYLTKYSVPGI